MDYFYLILEAIASLIALFFLTKILGKKQMGQLNMYDYIIGISIGNIVAEMAVNKEVDFFEGLVVMCIYVVMDCFVTYITTKSIKARRFLTGVPIVIIEDGRLIEAALKKTKLDINDLLEESRINGYFDLSEIEYAIMESNGRVSFLPKSKFKPLSSNDMKVKSPYKGLTANLIIDGKIMRENLDYVKKDAKWLIVRLKNMGYQDIEELLLVVCDSNEVLTVYEKGISQQKSNCLE